MENNKFKKGDRVIVWSLQSFSGGGFLNGEPAFVRQDQKGSSVILCVIRNFSGTYKLDKSYEVYSKQCELVNGTKTTNNSDYEKAVIDLENHYNEIMENKYI